MRLAERWSVQQAIREVFENIASESIDIDEEIMPRVPRNYFPMMTIHQAKGLEFPLTIVDVGSDFRVIDGLIQLVEVHATPVALLCLPFASLMGLSSFSESILGKAGMSRKHIILPSISLLRRQGELRRRGHQGRGIGPIAPQSVEPRRAPSLRRASLHHQRG